MAITAQQVKELRELTDCGIMDCKKALTECDGDIEKAKAWLREKGMAKAEKKSARIAAEGAVVSKIADDLKSGVLVEINIETDFAANTDKFKAFVDKMQPVLVVQSADDFTSQAADLVMTVRVKDTNPSNPTVTIYKPKADGSVVPENELASATRVNVSPSANIEDVDNTSAADPYKEYKITIPFKTSKSEFGSDGTYTIALNEKDGKNRTANQIVWTVLQDTCCNAEKLYCKHTA